MSQLKEFLLPDIGADSADITEILISVGDLVEVEQDILTIEGDKASMDVPASFNGIVKEIKVSEGDSVSEGNLVLIYEDADASEVTEAPVAFETQVSQADPIEEKVIEPKAASITTSAIVEVSIPDIGADAVEVIDLLVNVGDVIEIDQDLISVEGDKASMDIPSPVAGIVKEIKTAIGDKVSEGTLILIVETQSQVTETPTIVAANSNSPSASVEKKVDIEIAPAVEPFVAPTGTTTDTFVDCRIYASPSIRRFAHAFGVDLTKIKGTGRKSRILKDDIKLFIKTQLAAPKATNPVINSGNALEALPFNDVDFSKFGEIEEKPLSRIQKISGPILHRNWVRIPHVTQFDEVDITELEAFRKEQNAIAAKKDLGYKISPLLFMVKAVAKSLQDHPKFNSSLSNDGQSLIYKKYFNIGIAVDTPNGLVVPVIKDVLNKGIIELATELAGISKKARDGKLTAKDMQGGCMTISSLGGLGGTKFTPIVNAPEIAILGVSRSAIKPTWNGSEFKPRLILPLNLSYDHRVIDGADGARFITSINNYLTDLRSLIL